MLLSPVAPELNTVGRSQASCGPGALQHGVSPTSSRRAPWPPASSLLSASVSLSFFFFFLTFPEQGDLGSAQTSRGFSVCRQNIHQFPTWCEALFLGGDVRTWGGSEFGGTKGCSPLAVSPKRVHHWDRPPRVAPTCPCSSGLRDPLSSALKRSQGLFFVNRVAVSGDF